MILFKDKKKALSAFFSKSISSNSKISNKKIVLNLKKNSKFKKLGSFYKFKNIFFKYDRVVCKKWRWVYNSKNFRNILYLRNRINQYFDGVFSNSFFKKGLEKKSSALDFVRYSYIKPEFRLDIILWRLLFFPSPYAARIAILKNQILVNGVSVYFSYFLNQGDIFLVNTPIDLSSVTKLKLRNFNFNSFVEVDYYTNTFILLQDFKLLSVDSLPCVIRQPFKVFSHLSYLKKN